MFAMKQKKKGTPAQPVFAWDATINMCWQCIKEFKQKHVTQTMCANKLNISHICSM